MFSVSNNMAKNILIIAGESSGDLYGAHLVRALQEHSPGVSFFGIGGPEMKKAGVEILYPIDELSIIGVFEVLGKLGVIRAAFRALTQKIDRTKTDLAILVNYPGFNLKFAIELKKRGIPVVFYSSPQVWAWGKWRLGIIKRCVDKMIVFFKFEKDFYWKNGVEAEFVGHPLVDIVKTTGELDKMRSGGASKTVSLVPGSRRSEINNLFSPMLKAAEIIWSKDNGVRFLVTKHPEMPADIYLKKMRAHELPLTLVDGKTYDCLAASDLAIVASGSVTLEAAILKTPMIITNRISLLNVILYLLLVRLANVGLVNIIAGKRVMPELLQYDATPERIAAEALDMLNNAERYRQLKEDLDYVNILVGPPGASSRAAEIILKMLA